MIQGASKQHARLAIFEGFREKKKTTLRGALIGLLRSDVRIAIADSLSLA